MGWNMRLVKAIANATSIVSIPPAVLSLTTEPMDWYGYALLAFALIVQVLKYYAEDKIEFETEE